MLATHELVIMIIMMMMLMIVMMNVVMSEDAAAASQAVTAGPYLDSFTIQDSCQFNLCGPEYSQEFLQGEIIYTL